MRDKPQNTDNSAKKRNIFRKRNTVIAIVALLAVIGGIVGGVLALGGGRVDYLRDDLSKYVLISDEDYKNATVKLNAIPPTAADIREREMLDLIGYKTEVDASLNKEGELGAGDILYGLKIEVIGQSREKLFEAEMASHIIGARFIVGGYELCGVNYSLEGKSISLSSDERAELSLAARLPYSYPDPSIAGSGVTVMLSFDGFSDYDLPKLTDDFIKDRLKLSDKLADFDGETLTDKYHNSIESAILDDYRANVDSLKEELIWEHLLSCAKVNKLPSKEVKEKYDGYILEVSTAYSESGTGATQDAFAKAYLGLPEASDWRSYLMAEAEAAITQKLVFYYIIRKEEWLPTGAELDKLYNEAVEEYLQPYLKYEVLCLREAYASDEEYTAAVNRHRADLIASYGEDYFLDAAYLKRGMEKLKDLIKFDEISRE